MRNNHNGGRRGEDVISVSLDEIFIPERSIERIMRKDHAQIEQMRADIENGRTAFRVVLRPHCGGGYEIEDGRHRVIAAKLAGVGFIEAIVVGEIA